MIDLETLHTRPHAVILVLAGIKFNRYKQTFSTFEEIPKEDIFYRKIKVRSCLKIGMEIDPKTLSWWKKQKLEIRNEAFGAPRDKIEDVLSLFSKWVQKTTDPNYVKIWGHGAGFDCSILKEAYIRCELKAPWNFWNERDTRTLYDIANIKTNELPSQSKHHALYDCYRQIIGVWLSLNLILK